MKIKERITLSIFSVFVILAMLAISVLPAGVVQAQSPSGIVLVPTIVEPSGIITDTNPAFKWTPVPSATKYHYKVFKVGSLTPILDKTPKVSTTLCTTTLCTHRPTDVLKYGNYTWRIAAVIGGVQQAWSPATAFTISPPPIGFVSDFNADMVNWGTKAGATWKREAGALYTPGVLSKWSSAAYMKSQAYSNIDFYARVKRTGNAADANCMNIRMGSTNIASNNRWQTGYAFCYNNAGQYQIARRNAVGDPTMLQDWTAHSVIKPNDWNTLRVIAVDADIFFFINNKMVKRIYTTTFTIGSVGFEMYKSSGVADKFQVDWAKMNVLWNKALITRLLSIY